MYRSAYKVPVVLVRWRRFGTYAVAREVIESGAGTRSGPLSGFDISVLIEILWIPPPHVSSVIETVQNSSENTENDQRGNDVKLFIEFYFRMKRFLIKLHL